MHPPRKIQAIAQHRQSFARDTLGQVPHPLAIGIGSQPPEAGIAEQVQDLAMEIYARVAAEKILNGDQKTMEELARDAQRAALTYFQQLGVQFEEPTNE